MVAVEAAQLVIERLAVALGLLEALDPLLGGADAERCPFWRVLIASAIARRWVLLVPGGAKKQTLLRSVIQASCASCRISGFSAPGWAVKSKPSSVS